MSDMSTVEQKPIRVLHVLAAMHFAGTETLLMNLYRNVDRERVQFDFAVQSITEQPYDAEILQLGGKIYHYPRYRGLNHRAYVRWWYQFFKEHPEYRIVHGHIGSTAAIYLSIAKRYDCYAIAHSHSIHEKMGIRNLFEKKMVHDILYKVYSWRTRKVADFFFGCSHGALVDRYGRKVAEDAQWSRVQNNAIEVSKFVYNEQYRQEVRSEYSIGNDEFVVGTVGRLTLQKNPRMLINIVYELKRRGIGFKFLWIGTGELRQYVETEIARCGLGDCVVLAGVRKDVYKIYSAIDEFLFPSRWEGLGIVAVEAQAAGLPTLCSEVVPLEAKCTELFHSLPLDDVGRWVDEIVRQRGVKRTDRSEEIKATNYDICAEAHKLQEFYEQRYNERLKNK